MAYPGTLQVDYATPYETSTTKLPYPVGQKAETPDGCIFRYSEMAGTTGVANKLYQSAAPTAHWCTQAVAVALAVGDTEISQHDGGTAFTVNQMAGGTIVVEETSDLGHIYRVKSNVVTAANETVCQLEDGVTVQKEMAVAANNHGSLEPVDGCSPRTVTSYGDGRRYPPHHHRSERLRLASDSRPGVLCD